MDKQQLEIEISRLCRRYAQKSGDRIELVDVNYETGNYETEVIVSVPEVSDGSGE
jgi:hypothetical protein